MSARKSTALSVSAQGQWPSGKDLLGNLGLKKLSRLRGAREGLPGRKNNVGSQGGEEPGTFQDLKRLRVTAGQSEESSAVEVVPPSPQTRQVLPGRTGVGVSGLSLGGSLDPPWSSTFGPDLFPSPLQSCWLQRRPHTCE